MKRWTGALIAVVLACVPILLQRASSLDLLLDTDTKVLLATIRARHAPLSWFTGDWPLFNHFYRPVSTLSFELDNRLYGANAAGYGLTNDLLCIACVLLLFWFLRELTDRPLVAAGGAVMFAVQHVGFPSYLVSPLPYLAIFTGVVGIVRHRQKVGNWAPAVLVLLYLPGELFGVANFSGGVIAWLPGRTATVMTVFALVAMAAYARYERLGADRSTPKPTPLDPPATRNTALRKAEPRAILFWPILSLVATALALGAYEQAVMLPGVLLAVAVTMRAARYRVRWGWQAGFWLLLFAYLVLRKLVIPTGVSQYQAQQLRYGPGVYHSLLEYALPFANGIAGFLSDIEMGAVILMTLMPYQFLLSAAANITSFYQARRRWVWALAGYGMSMIAFLPMAWVKHFPHYDYWPMALRSLFTVSLIWVAGELIAIAWSPPTRPAPPRPDPAPGSLPHR